MQSMTGFGSGQSSGDPGSVVIEIKTVNSRYLDLQFRMPDELRLAEMMLRERIAKAINRGKVDVRASYTRAVTEAQTQISAKALERIASTYDNVRQHIPQLAPLTFSDVLQWPDPDKSSADPSLWVPLCERAVDEALEQLVATREREGARLVQVISAQADQVSQLVEDLLAQLPAIMTAQRDRLAQRLRDAFDQASSGGLPHISATEISERLAAEVNAFNLRADVAEELDRLKLHIAELRELLTGSSRQAPGKAGAGKQGIGKRLDFLFQEMNREANTLGSKAVHVSLTRAAIDLKLLIEQMREQIQNIE